MEPAIAQDRDDVRVAGHRIPQGAAGQPVLGPHFGDQGQPLGAIEPLRLIRGELQLVDGDRDHGTSWDRLAVGDPADAHQCP